MKAKLRNALGALLVALTLPAAHAQGKAPEIDPETGFVVATGFPVVKAYCTACHSAKLVTQAGKSRASWIESIRWMQRTQGLFDLGPAEGEILDYLATHYGIKAEVGGMLKLVPLPPHLMPPAPGKASN